MSAYIVPDSIEPVEAFRCWNLVDGKLVSITNGEVWKPGESLTARCVDGPGVGYRWTFARNGSGLNVMTREEAYERAHPQVDVTAFGGTSSQYLRGAFGYGDPRIPNPPSVEPPDGYGFALERISHDCPHEHCVCGIYAVDDFDRVPASGTVYGKVKLWGKIIPGEKGYRAEYAYPSEFWVPPEMEPDDALLAFDVPIVVKDDLPKQGKRPTVSLSFTGANWNTYANTVGWDFTSASQPNWAKRVMYGAAAINLGCAAVNLLVGFHVV